MIAKIILKLTISQLEIVFLHKLSSEHQPQLRKTMFDFKEGYIIYFNTEQRLDRSIVIHFLCLAAQRAFLNVFLYPNHRVMTHLTKNAKIKCGTK